MTIFVRPHEFNQSNLIFLVKNTLLINSHLERFNTVCIPFLMERHIYTNAFTTDKSLAKSLLNF